MHTEVFYLVLMRSAAYKALQERVTRTVCSQATLPLYWLADIQFFQSFPKWHRVKFVAHHLCPQSLVTACTLWHSKQSNPNLLPAFEIRRGEGPWNADGSIWCFVKTEVPDHRYGENENQPLEKSASSQNGTSQKCDRQVEAWSVFVILADPLDLVPQGSLEEWTYPLTSSAAQQSLGGARGAQHIYETSAHMTDPGSLKGRAAKELYKFCSWWGGAKQGGAHLCQGTQAAFLTASPCVAQLIAQRSLVCWPCCCAASPAPVWSTMAQGGTQNSSESRALEASVGRRVTKAKKKQKKKTLWFFPGKRFGLHCVKRYTQ